MAETPDLNYSRDLLQRFRCGRGDKSDNCFPVKSKEEDGPPENVELSLGLSLNGKFGNNDNNYVNKLNRASSVTDFVNLPVDVELSLYSPLTRTCSLPPETETEWRKRKEMQSLRRSEAKRKRDEKLKNVRVVKGRTDEENWGLNRRNGIELLGEGLKKLPPSPPPTVVQFSSQGSIVSQGSGGSSGVSDLDSQPPGIKKDTSETNKHCEHKKVEWNPKIKPVVRFPNDQTMPCVSTKGDGPDGKGIQGFLYRYGKGEEVRIVCVCHGSLLTPAEFVKHGGGGDVEHPSRHIVVTSSLLS